MLRYTINSHNMGSSYTPIDFKKCFLSGNSIYVVNNCNIKKNDILQFSRNIGDNEAFVENVVVDSVFDGGFTVKTFKDIRGYVENFIEFKKKKTPHSSISNFGEFIFQGSHCFIENRAITPKENIVGDYSQYDESLRRCDGDYVTYEGVFLYKASVSEGKYIFNDMDIENICDVTLMLSGGGIEDYFQDRANNGSDWEYNSNVLYLKNCIVPMDNDCRDNRRHIIWEGDENIIHFIELNWRKINVLYHDERFLKIRGGNIEVKNGTKIFKKEGFIRINALTEEDFSTGLFQENQNATLIHDTINGGKNGVIDYERKTFYPVYGNNEMVESIKFNLHFRKRSNTDEWKSIDGVDNDWNTPEKGHSDKLLSHMNFEKADIEYRKKKLSKSFLRLSFYDAADRRTQSLITYSTIFFDTGKLYKKYLEASGNDIESEIMCTSKYNTESSSEGFYIYLFPSLVENVKSTEIYMKVEFNHAKYGYTIPFVHFNGNPKENYIKKEWVTIGGKTEERKYIDMNALNTDMYIPITISEKNGRYTWKIADSARDTVIDLYEPIVN